MLDPDVDDSDRTTHGSNIPALPTPLLVSLSGCARDTGTSSTLAVTTGEGRIGGTSSQSSFDDHVGEEGFWLPADRLTLSATSASTLSLVPSSVHTALADLN
jgi:hypothetical protein